MKRIPVAFGSAATALAAILALSACAPSGGGGSITTDGSAAPAESDACGAIMIYTGAPQGDLNELQTALGFTLPTSPDCVTAFDHGSSIAWEAYYLDPDAGAQAAVDQAAVAGGWSVKSSQPGYDSYFLEGSADALIVATYDEPPAPDFPVTEPYVYVSLSARK